jgi:hypothetical protein
VVHNIKAINGILDALWNFGLRKTAVQLLSLVRERGVFEEAIRRSETIWAVDVHRCGFTKH